MQLKLGDDLNQDYLLPSTTILLKASSAYFMNNREIFINFINTLFNPYIAKLKIAQEEVSCDKKAGDFSLLIHQKIVRDYINNLTPYRGLLIISWFRFR